MPADDDRPRVPRSKGSSDTGSKVAAISADVHRTGVSNFN